MEKISYNSSFKFKNYESVLKKDCLNLFDSNCPEFFAKNEKNDYMKFLENNAENYKVVFSGTQVAAAFGFDLNKHHNRGRISWIMVSPIFKGLGIGAKIMERVKQLAGIQKIKKIDIAASHLSALFFAKFGAIALERIPNGWGPGMHRVDMELTL